MAFRDHVVALSHRNFRLIWFGLFASMTGSMMQNAALLWHVSLLVAPEKKAIALGAVGLVRVVPIVCLSMVSGVVADAWNRAMIQRTPMVRPGIATTILAQPCFKTQRHFGGNRSTSTEHTRQRNA